jgi:hypothetical protein
MPSQAKPTEPDQPCIVARDLEAKFQPVKRYMQFDKGDVSKEKEEMRGISESM